MDSSDSDIKLDSSMLKMLYYDYYTKGKIGKMTFHDFVTFLNNDVLTNESFKGEFDKDIVAQIDKLKIFSDKNELNKKRTSKELADIMDMNKEDIDKLFVFYFGKYGNNSSQKMTLNDFVNFLKNDVASNKDYAKAFDEKTWGMIDTLAVFTDKDMVTTEKSIPQLASMLNIDEAMVKNILMYYYINKGGVSAGKMSLPTFVSFIQNDVAKNPQYASNFDENTMQSISSLAAFTNKEAITTPYDGNTIGKLLNMDEQMVTQVFYMYSAQAGDSFTGKMSLQEFVTFILNNVITNPEFAPYFDEATVAQLGMMDKIMACYHCWN